MDGDCEGAGPQMGVRGTVSLRFHYIFFNQLTLFSPNKITKLKIKFKKTNWGFLARLCYFRLALKYVFFSLKSVNIFTNALKWELVLDMSMSSP